MCERLDGPQLVNFDIPEIIIDYYSIKSPLWSILHGATLYFLDLFFAILLFASLSSLQAKQATNAVCAR